MPENRELIKLLGNAFIQRKDVKAEQSHDGPWYPKREKFTILDFERHFRGDITLGHYLLDPEGLCKLFAFDIDLIKDECQISDFENLVHNIAPKVAWSTPGDATIPQLTMSLRCLADALAMMIHTNLGLHTAISVSGSKGLHVYGFTGSPVHADIARGLGIELMYKAGFGPTRGDNFFRSSEHPFVEIEVFPKQDSLEGKDLGNLMGLPLGYHRRTGVKKIFIDSKNPYTELIELDPFQVLSGRLPWE